MARLPIPVTEIAASGSSNIRRATASSFGGGAGLIAIGAGLGQIGDALQARQNEKENFEVSKRITDEMLFNVRNLNTLKENAPLGADGFTDDYISDFNARRESNIVAMRKSGMSEKAVQKFDLAVRRIGVAGARNALTFQSSAHGVKVALDVADNTKNLSQLVQADPSQLGVAIQQSDQLIDDLAGIKPNLKAKLKADNRKDLEWAAGLGMVNTDAVTVVKMLSSTGTGKGGIQGYLDRIKQQESGGKSNAQNPLSTAHGLFQITKGTWDFIQNSPEGKAAGIVSFADGKSNDDQNTKVAEILTAKNATVLTNAGVEVTGGNLYMAHFLGAGRVAQVLQLPDNTGAREAFTAAEIKSNPFLLKHNAGSFKAFVSRVGGGKVAAVTGKTGNPVLDSLNAVQRQRLLNMAMVRQGKVADALRDENTQRSNNEIAAASTGQDVGNPLTREEFLAARPNDKPQGEREFEEHETAVAVGKQVFGMRDMTPAQIADVVDQVLPEDKDDPGFALALKQQKILKRAQAQTIKARKDDPVKYALTYDTDVQAKFKFMQDNPGNQGRVAAYLGAIDIAQERYGIPVRDRVLLPKAMVDDAIENINDTNNGDDIRQNALLSVVFSSNEPDQQLRIFEQFVKQDSGLAKFQSAIEAFSRGDTAAAGRLFSAGFTKVDLKTVTTVTSQQVGEAILNEVMATGKIGDAVYSRSAGIRGNDERQRRDTLILTDAINAGLRNQQTLEDATTQAIADVFGPVSTADNIGDVNPVTNVSVTMPNNIDERTMLTGFGNFVHVIREALEINILKAPIAGDTPAETAQKTLLNQSHIDWLIDNGQWANGPNKDTYVFVDTQSGKPIPDVDGKVFIVMLDEILNASTFVDKPQPTGVRQEDLSKPVNPFVTTIVN